METIYRYALKDGVNDIDMPAGAEILKYVGLVEEMVDLNPMDESQFEGMDADRAKIMRNLGAGPSLSGIQKVKKDVISIWAKVETSSSLEKRRILVFGTGADMSDVANFRLEPIGTVQKSNKYAFHVFEVTDK